MRIAVNCLNTTTGQKSGVNTYTMGMIAGLIHELKDHTLTIYTTPEAASLFEEYRSLSNVHIVEYPFMNTTTRRLIRRLALLSANKKIYKFTIDRIFSDLTQILDQNSDIIYTPTTVLFPYSNTKPTVVSLHDIQHVHFPEFFTSSQLIRRKVFHGLTIDYATHIQSSSQFIKNDILKHYPQRATENISVIAEGVDIESFSSPRGPDNLEEKYNIPAQFLFCPAQLWPHKNHLTILKALLRLRQDGIFIPLVLTGAKYSAANEIFEFIKRHKLDQVYYLGLVPYDDLINLYHKAKFFITAVLYESSSLPCLEAAAAHTPLVASRTPPNEEMAKVLNMNLFNPLDELELSNLLKKIWDDEVLQKTQIIHNDQNIHQYSWNNIAKQYIKLFEEKVSTNG